MYPHAPLHPFGAHEGASRQLGCHGEFLQFAALRRHAQALTSGGLHVSVHTPHAAIHFPSPRAGVCSFDIPFRVWQAEEAVANLSLRLAVRVRCGNQG